MKKKIVSAVSAAMAICLVGTSFAACSKKESSSGAFDPAKNISVITREEGSGTRDAFVELTGVMVKESNGNKTDHTTGDALTIDSTQAVMSNVAGNTYAVGYISLGSLNDTVKAVKVGGVEVSPENIKNGTYELSRPFNIASKDTLSAAAQDFIDFILSADGQKVVKDNGYIDIGTAGAYSGSMPEGKIVIAGSSSVAPVMEKLKEAYCAINTNVKIEIQSTDSSAGMTSAVDGTCDIGMASRALKDSEKAQLKETKIAMDGIAVIVNKNNTCEELTIAQIKSIFTGEFAAWDNVKNG